MIDSFTDSTFSTVDKVLEAARHMVAMQIARDPLVRQCVRQTFYERAKVKIRPTKKGKKVLRITHGYFTVNESSKTFITSEILSFALLIGQTTSLHQGNFVVRIADWTNDIFSLVKFHCSRC